MVIEDWAVVTGLIGVILTFISALIAGVFSIKIFLLKKKENEKRDNAQIGRDAAHIANLIYKNVNQNGRDRIGEEVGLYGEILKEVKAELEKKNRGIIE